MTRNRKVSMFFLSTILAMLAIGFSAFGALAAPHSYGVAHVGHGNAAPTVKISGNPANYHPKKITVHVKNTPSFNITNTEKVAESVTYMGSVLVTIQPGQTAGIQCNRPNKAVFSLQSNPKAALHINCLA